MNSEPTWTTIGNETYGVWGTGVVFAPVFVGPNVRADLSAAGFRLVELDGSGVSTFREVQRRIAETLDLPASAGENLDALADSLGSLADGPDGRIAMIWAHTEEVIVRDLIGWYRLVEVLKEASAKLWDRGQVVFETLQLIEGFGVGRTTL